MTDTQKFEYWIETGRTNGQFTLHRRLVGRPRHWAVNEYTYIRNIGRIYEEAVERADKYIDENHPKGFGIVKDYAPGEGGELRHPGEYVCDTLWFGKYTGADLEDVVANDPEYLRYIRDNFHRASGNPKMTALLKQIDDMELGESERERAYRERQEQRAQEEIEWHDRKQPIPTELAEGRSTFTGKVIATYERETQFGIQNKMIFEDDRGFKLSSTAPRALWNDFTDSPRGCEIQFDAAVVISDDDPCFGFAKRPTKVIVTKETRNNA